MRTWYSAVQRGLYGVAAAAAMMLIGTQFMPACAAGDTRSVSVRYDGHDLGSDAAARRLLRQIEVAAHQVCLDQDLEPLPMHQVARRCYFAALANAIDAVNAPRLRAAYVAKYGTVAPSREVTRRRVRSLRRRG